MKITLFTTLSYIAVTNALVAREGTCCFGLNAAGAGGADATVGQLGDGQNRVNGGLPPASYCIDLSGGITDSSGRGCILTPPTTQFQCDTSATPTPGFAIACDGILSFNGSSHFFECPTGDNGENNIYTTTPGGQQGCFEITLGATSCKSGCPAPSAAPPPPTTTSAAPPASTPSSKICPTDLSTPYQYPHLIIPVSSTSPTTAAGTSYNGLVNSTTSSLFVFDIPASYAGSTCTVLFLLPPLSSLQTSSYTISGGGAIDFAKLSNNAAQSTTWDNKPSVGTDYGDTTLTAGSSSVISSGPCAAGAQVTYELSSSETSLEWFQDYNSPAIGFYIASC